jgi:hypothetical protein
MMITIFKCQTKDCPYNSNPVRTVNATNPVLCGWCFCYSVAVESEEPAPTFE